MQRLYSFFLSFALLPLAGPADAAITNIAQLPLLNISGSGVVKPNLMLLFDNSGSMGSTFTPDYVDDSTTCRSRTLMSGGTRACAIGHPPFNSADFNKQYYSPAVLYAPPVKADASFYPSQNRALTTGWTRVTPDAFGVNDTNFLGAGESSSDLVTKFPDLKWCDTTGNNCAFNSATYAYPDDVRYTPLVFTANPYYYAIGVGEYCSDANLTVCQTVGAGGAAPVNFPFPAQVRWCNSTALSNCQAKYVGAFKYPRYSSPTSGQLAAYGTIVIKASSGSSAQLINSVSVQEPGATVIITNGAITAASGTDTSAKQASVATQVAASIIAKSGLVNQYTACVRTPSPTGAVPTCASFGITLAANNMVAVIPITCPAGTTGKGVGPCAVLTDASRNGWAVTVNTPPLSAPAFSTALLSFSGATKLNSQATLTTLRLGSTNLLSSTMTFTKSADSVQVAKDLVARIGTAGAIDAYLGGNPISPLCAAAANPASTVCLVNPSSSASANLAITLGSWTNLNTLSWTTSNSSAYVSPVTDMIATDNGVLGTGSAVFVRTDIVASRNSYPKGSMRSDCAGASCTYDEEMTNFANWYAYYKTRNQMMKSAVGLAFAPLQDNYRVGLVALSVAALQGPMKGPKPFVGSDRAAWYSALYAMNGSGSTPLRPALHAIGKMFANRSPYVATSGAEVIQYPCQQNFTFVTTDGYWNGNAAPDVTNNDTVENASRFCLRSKGCVDPAAQTGNTLADVALYWYNGGSNTSATSLRPDLENWSKPLGQVAGAAGDNTRLHMNTYGVGLGVDGVMTYESGYDKAPLVGGDFYKLVSGVTSGCSWNANGPYVWPDTVSSDTSGSATYQSRVDDLWHAAINGHGKYFSASNPQQVVDVLRSALNNIEQKIGAAAAAATSTPNISQQDNDIFSATFTTVQWVGELSDKKIDIITGEVGAAAQWSTSLVVGKKVGPSSDTRSIKMRNVATGMLEEFSYANLSAGMERDWFDNKCSVLSQCSSLSAGDKAIVNSGANIVNWLRGQQQYANDTLLRAYSQSSTKPAGMSTTIPIVLGDIASSKPAFLREPRKAYTLAGYSKYKSDNANRRPVVFAAANDGMLHAFDTASGEELWAYMPRITMAKLHLQASTTYGINHQFSTDGSPELGDVQIGGVWKTILVAGLNGGGRGYYALDVTDPVNPVALWEICADAAICGGAKHIPNLGLTFGNPQFGTWKDALGVAHWVVFVASGYNNAPGTTSLASSPGEGILYVVDVADGHVLATISNRSGDAATPSGLAKITAITTNPNTDPQVTAVYGGDNQGQMWRFSFAVPGMPTVVKMGDAGVLQPITSRPEVTLCKVGTGVAATVKTVVVFGTGRLLDVPDVTNTDVQSTYALLDKPAGIVAGDWRNTGKMARQVLARIGGGGDSYSSSGTKVDFSTHSGWWVDFNQNAGERVNLDPKVVSGGLNIVTNLPSSSSACSVGGTSNVYQLDVCTGAAINSGSGINDANSGALAIAGTTLSSASAAVGFIIIRLPSGALKMITTTADGNTITSGVAPAITLGSRKTGWRRVKN